MAKTMAGFVRAYNGTWNDLDGVFGAQCVDGYKLYCQYLGIPSNSGNAIDLWNNGHHACCKSYTTGTPKDGDILIYSGGPFGHVGMSWKGQCFGQNQHGEINGGNGSAPGSNFCTLTPNMTLKGYFRPSSKYLREGYGGIPEISIQKGFIVGIRDYNGNEVLK